MILFYSFTDVSPQNNLEILYVCLNMLIGTGVF